MRSQTEQADTGAMKSRAIDSAIEQNSRQLSMLDLFVATTILALILAPLAPLLRGFGSEQLFKIGVMFGFQFVAVVATVFLQSHRRRGFRANL